MKCDPILGEKIKKHLEELGIETPMKDWYHNMTDDQKIDIISKSMNDIMKVLGYDVTDDSLVGTPDRVAKMWVKELMWGLDKNKFPKVTTIENKMNYDEMLVEKDITIKSVCEHHFVTIIGKAHVAYIPNKKIIGLSKINRICNYFARRGQVQERLTVQILEALKYILETENVAVVLNCEHFCVITRGIEDTSSKTVTSALGGVFRSDYKVRSEFMELIK